MTKSDNLVGIQLGDYKLTRKLTSGGMSYVYLGVDEKLDRRAAVKLLTADISGADTTLAERFKREAKAIAALEHDNIITIYQYGESPEHDLYFIAMRFVDGHDLADELNALHRKGQRLGINRALKILEQVAAALDFAHKAGIIHRDIKPSNILIDKNDKAYLSDFGLVLRQSVDQTLGTAFGTPRYISPEQATDSQLAVPQSDIYSLGIIVYEIVTGQTPFKGATPMEMAISHITEKPRPPREINAEIPVAVEREILKALEKDPDKRHQTAGEFIRALRRAYNMSANEASITEIDATTAATMPANPKAAQSTPVMSDADMKAAVQAQKSIADADEPTITPVPVQPTLVFKDTPALPQTAAPRPRRRRSRLWPFILLLLSIAVLGTASIVFQYQREGRLPDVSVWLAFLNITSEPRLVLAAATEEPTTAITDEASITPTATTNSAIMPSATLTASPTSTATATVTASHTPSPSMTPTTSPTPTATDTATLTETSVPLVGIGGGTAILRYNAEAFALQNDGDQPLDVSKLALVRGAAGDGDDFAGNIVAGGILRANECIVVISSTSGARLPSEWGCTAIASQTTRPSSGLFWRVDSAGNDTFAVLIGETPLTDCASVGRAGENTCVVNWPEQ